MTELSPAVPVPAAAPEAPTAPVVATPVEVAVVPSGLRPSHVAGGGTGSVIGTVVVAVLAHFHLHVSDVDAVMIGSGALSLGVGLGHVIGKVGVFGAVGQFLHGSRA